MWGLLTAARRAQDLARQGFGYLEGVARGGKLLGLLLYGLAAEAGRGTQKDVRLAHQVGVPCPRGPVAY